MCWASGSGRSAIPRRYGSGQGEVLVTDGPFAETKEQIGGFDILDCADLDEAIEVAAKHPCRAVRHARAPALLGDRDRRRGRRDASPRPSGASAPASWRR